MYLSGYAIGTVYCIPEADAKFCTDVDNGPLVLAVAVSVANVIRSTVDTISP
jgi:hypothetical protein